MQAMFYGGPVHGRIILLKGERNDTPPFLYAPAEDWLKTGNTVKCTRRLIPANFAQYYVVYVADHNASMRDIVALLKEKGVLPCV